MFRLFFSVFFFFNDTATTEIYTLSLHERSSDLSTRWWRCGRSKDGTHEGMAAGNAWGRLRTVAPLPAAFFRQRTGYHLGPNRACADRRHLHVPALVSDD